MPSWPVTPVITPFSSPPPYPMVPTFPPIFVQSRNYRDSHPGRVNLRCAGEMQALLLRIIKRLLKLLTGKGFLIEEQGMTYLADTGPDLALGPL